MAQPQATHKVVKQVVKHQPLTGVREFEKRVRKNWFTRGGQRVEVQDYSIRLAHDGRQERVNLGTADLREAARRAARFHAVLKASGWDAAFADLSPEQARVKARSAVPTVGELIEAAERVAVHVKPTTLRQYGQSLRWLAAEVAGIEGDVRRFDYRNGGADAWRAEVDKVSLAVLTPRSVESSVAAYIKRRSATDDAKRTASSFLRQARGFWSRKLLRILPFEELPPNPFQNLVIERARAPKYVPTFDSAVLVAAAKSELRNDDPQAWLAFLLMLGAGLRKGEADALVWSNVDLHRGIIRIITGKTADSVGEVPLGPEAVEELRRLSTKATGLHVLDGTDAPHDPTVRVYRADATFNRLSSWLRNRGVTDRKPLHALRKEAGSLVNAVAGIHAASRFLRHADIAVTAAHYADARNRVVVPLFNEPKAAKA